MFTASLWFKDQTIKNCLVFEPNQINLRDLCPKYSKKCKTKLKEGTVSPAKDANDLNRQACMYHQHQFDQNRTCPR